MFVARSNGIRLGLFLTLFATTPTPVPAQSGSGHYLHISDIHFNPFYDCSLFEQLDAEPVENWRSILEKSQPAGFNPVGQDSNYALIKSSLDDACRRTPAPDFLLVAGDFLAHRWQSSYDHAAKKSHVADPQAYRVFTAKVIRFLAGEFHRRYPTTPILPALGNDDCDCGDYAITPQGPFLEMFAAAWAPLLGPGVDRDAFRASFSRGGYFSLKIPRARAHRLIVLNSVFFSAKYANTCGTSGQTPAVDELAWFATELERARAAGETVWLLMHIPPGIDSFATVESAKVNGPVVLLWHPEWTGRYLQLVERYQATIQATFGGHMHSDDFRVIRRDGKPVLFTKLAPSISPIFGNNPGYQVGQYDRQTGAIANYQTYYLTDLARGGKPAAPAAGSWALEYSFRDAYGYPALNSHSITQLAEGLNTNAAIQRNYIQFYTVSAAPEPNAQTIGIFRGAILSVTPAEFEAGYRGGAVLLRSPPVPDKRAVGSVAPR